MLGCEAGNFGCWRFLAAPLPRETCRMLVLSRKRNESIVIDENIVITVVEVRGDKVRLGIEAPREVPVHRSEVHEAISIEQSAVTGSDTDSATISSPEG